MMPDATQRGPNASKTAIAIQPEWLVPLESDPIQNGWLVVESGTIAYLGQELPDRYANLSRYALQRCAILPGLINSHCHLEFSDLRQSIPAEGCFADWLQRVIELRRSHAALSPEEHREQRAYAIERGVLASWRYGVRWVVDMVTEPWDRLWINRTLSACRATLPHIARDALVPESLLYVQPCFEMLDVQQQRASATERFAVEQITAPKSPWMGQAGLAPHAPYTASLPLTQRSVELARPEARLVSMHLAETREERAWLEGRSGSLGAWIDPWLDDAHRSSIATVQQHLAVLAGARRVLIAHGNYLDPTERQWISDHRDAVAVVYCPRTHAHFGHSQHPASDLLQRGVDVLLGTDSRASNPEESIWEEVRYASHHLTDLTPAHLAALVTIRPARFLETDGGIGRMRVGDRSLLTAFHWDHQSQTEPRASGSVESLWKLLFERATPIPLETHPRFRNSAD